MKRHRAAPDGGLGDATALRFGFEQGHGGRLGPARVRDHNSLTWWLRVEHQGLACGVDPLLKATPTRQVGEALRLMAKRLGKAP